MLAKLTLTIDEEVIAKAKEYAHRKKRSISKIVEEYLLVLSSNDNRTSDQKTSKSPLTKRLAGMFKKEYRGESYKKLLEDALMERNT